MANTTTVFGRMVEITGLDSNWVWSVDLPVYLQNSQLRRVKFRASAATDVLVIRAGSTTGPRVFQRDNVAQTQCMGEFGPQSGINPALAIADCTLSVAANASVMLEFD
jgi:hypothetical protein